MSNVPAEYRPFLLRVLIVAGVAVPLLVLLYLFREVAQVLLLVFAAILLAQFLSGLAMFLHHRTTLSRSVALAIVAVGLLALSATIAWLAGPRIAEQFGQLSERIPEAVEQIRSSLQQEAWMEPLLQQAPTPEQVAASGSDVVGHITGFFSTALGAVTNTLLILIIGLYLAVNPSLYIDNLLRLLPKDRRERGHEVMAALGRALRWWIIGQVGAMTVVGTLTTIGLLIIGMPLAFTLGFIAFLFSFVPYIGPIASAIPALLVALGESMTKVGYVVIVYVAVQLLESNLITPLIQEKVVSLPPALLITAQLLLGVTAGILGILVATPLTVATIVLIQTVYVEDVLGDKAQVMGSHTDTETE